MTIRDIWLLGKKLLSHYNRVGKYTVSVMREIYAWNTCTIFIYRTQYYILLKYSSMQNNAEQRSIMDHIWPQPQNAKSLTIVRSGLSGNGLHLQSNSYKIIVPSELSIFLQLFCFSHVCSVCNRLNFRYSLHKFIKNFNFYNWRKA